jgi:hypothetical protein
MGTHRFVGFGKLVCTALIAAPVAVALACDTGDEDPYSYYPPGQAPTNTAPVAPGNPNPTPAPTTTTAPTTTKPNGNTGGTAWVPDNGGVGGVASVGPAGTCTGYATRFWDCCKPHCGWKGNVPGGQAMTSCNVNNQSIGVSEEQSACQGGGAYTCSTLSPWAVSSNLSYGFAATASGDICGKCYQLTFTGPSPSAMSDQGSKKLVGKTMIVQAVNIGYDVNPNGHFDILVPGGGLGNFDACTKQWKISAGELGEKYGGLLMTCKKTVGWNAGNDAHKKCLFDKCTSVFGNRGLKDLESGCKWYATWMEAADNPGLKYREVKCPPELVARSGINRGFTPTGCGN